MKISSEENDVLIQVCPAALLGTFSCTLLDDVIFFWDSKFYLTRCLITICSGIWFSPRHVTSIQPIFLLQTSPFGAMSPHVKFAALSAFSLSDSSIPMPRWGTWCPWSGVCQICRRTCWASPWPSWPRVEARHHTHRHTEPHTSSLNASVLNCFPFLVLGAMGHESLQSIKSLLTSCGPEMKGMRFCRFYEMSSLVRSCSDTVSI